MQLAGQVWRGGVEERKMPNGYPATIYFMAGANELTYSCSLSFDSYESFVGEDVLGEGGSSDQSGLSLGSESGRQRRQGCDCREGTQSRSWDTQVGRSGGTCHPSRQASSNKVEVGKLQNL